MMIPKRLRPTIHTFCSDMWDGYLGAATDFITTFPEVKAKVVIDRFHVAKNYRDDFDTLRKKEFRRLRKELPEDSYKEVTILLKIQFSWGHLWHEKTQGKPKMAFCKTLKFGRTGSHRN